MISKDQLINLFEFLYKKRNKEYPHWAFRFFPYRLPDEYFVDIKEMDLSEQNLTSIPKFLLKCRNLEVLNLSDNQIREIENLDNLSNLRRLDISWNQLTKLENLDTLVSLQTLTISYNQIKELEILEFKHKHPTMLVRWSK